MGFMNWWNNYWDAPPCRSCEELRSLLATEKHEKKQLLDTLLDTVKPKQMGEVQPIRQAEPIVPKAVSWRVRREMLEAEDRRQAEILKAHQEESKKGIEELEKELGLTDAS